MTHGRLTNPALVKPIDNAVLPPRTDPLDDTTQLQSARQNRLAADDTTEGHTTPEASLSHTELEMDTDTDFPATGADDDETPSQSTLSGTTFHTMHATSDFADSDESQQWQIAATERGTGTLEH